MYCIALIYYLLHAIYVKSNRYFDFNQIPVFAILNICNLEFFEFSHILKFYFKILKFSICTKNVKEVIIYKR